MTVQDSPIVLFAAGSLEAPLSRIADNFTAAHYQKVQCYFGPSGILREEIEWGETAHVFASANMEHPAALEAEGGGGPVALFARNALCALARPDMTVTPDTLVDVLLKDDVTVGISMPKADPSGDYAFAMFDKADGAVPGAADRLKAKALTLTGAPDSTPPPEGHNPYAWVIAEGAADIFLTYRTNGARAVAQKPDLQMVALPPQLAVSADYGLIVMNGAPEAAWCFALYMLSPAGQAILAEYGFDAANLPQGDR